MKTYDEASKEKGNLKIQLKNRKEMATVRKENWEKNQVLKGIRKTFFYKYEEEYIQLEWNTCLYREKDRLNHWSWLLSSSTTLKGTNLQKRSMIVRISTLQELTIVILLNGLTKLMRKILGGLFVNC
jgi:hypothetical protein